MNAIEDRTDALATVHSAIFPVEPKPAAKSPAKKINGHRPDDQKIIDKVMGDSKYARLWSGDIGAQPSPSEADLALCGRIGFFCEWNPSDMDRLFRQSALVRDKWDERHGEKTYGAMTIDKARAGKTDFYKWNGERSGCQKSDKANGGDATIGPVLIDMADVERVPVKWYWPSRIPIGRLTFMAGKPGEGKTFVATDIIARGTKGLRWPDDSGDAPIGSALLVMAEDSADDTIGPRLDAAGADNAKGKVKLLKSLRRIDPETGKAMDLMFTLAHVVELEQAIRSMPDLKILVIDPIGSFLGSRVDAHRDNEVRAVLAPLAALAEKYQLAVLVIAHTRKAFSANADDTVLGSRAFTGLARATWHLTHEKTDRDRKLFLPGKCNLCKQPDGMAFRIGGDPPSIVWERDGVKLHADDVLVDDEKPGPEPEARKAAEEWLIGVLKDGPVPSGDLHDPAEGSIRMLAKLADLAWRTVRRAADALGVRRERDQYTKTFVWRLPRTAKNQLGQGPTKKGIDGQHGQQEESPGNTEKTSITSIHVVHPDSARTKGGVN